MKSVIVPSVQSPPSMLKLHDFCNRADFEAQILESETFAAQWGELGPVYGKQWRRWLGPDGREHDQIATLIDTLRNTPASRRMLFHGWNVAELPEMALPPCHLIYQFHVSDPDRENGRPKLRSLLFQRSADCLLGLPFNLTNQALITHMLAQQADMDVGEMIWMGGDVHLYLNHLDQAREQLTREPRPFPRMHISRLPGSIDDYRIEDFQVTGYDPHPAIAAPVAV